MLVPQASPFEQGGNDISFPLTIGASAQLRAWYPVHRFPKA